jgi:hypothetical protein
LVLIEDLRASTDVDPHSLLHMDSHSVSEVVKDLNLLQVMAKEISESTGSRSIIVKRWSSASLTIGDADDDPMLLLLGVLFAMKKVAMLVVL